MLLKKGQNRFIESIRVIQIQQMMAPGKDLQPRIGNPFLQFSPLGVGLFVRMIMMVILLMMKLTIANMYITVSRKIVMEMGRAIFVILILMEMVLLMRKITVHLFLILK